MNEELMKFLDAAGLTQLWNEITSAFVKKAEGMGLSANDFTDDLKAKLDTINVKDIKVNGEKVQADNEGAVALTIPEGALAEKDKVAVDDFADALLTAFNKKANSAASLAGYGIADAYTKEQTDNAIKAAVARVYKIQGSIAFENLPVEGMAAGDVYNITQDFTTDNRFVEGTGHKYPAGTNVCWTGTGWDAMAGVYDFSSFVKKDSLSAITPEEITAICV